MDKGTLLTTILTWLMRGGATPETSYIQSCVYAHGCYDVIIGGYDVKSIKKVWKTLNVDEYLTHFRVSYINIYISQMHPLSHFKKKNVQCFIGGHLIGNTDYIYTRPSKICKLSPKRVQTSPLIIQIKVDPFVFSWKLILTTHILNYLFTLKEIWYTELHIITMN